VHAVSFDNDNLNLYAGSVGQHNTFEVGFYKFDSIDESWINQKNNVLVNDILTILNNDIYIGCIVGVGGYPYGVFKSSDNGETWENMNSGITGASALQLANNPSHFLYAITSNPSTLNRSLQPIIVSINEYNNDSFEIKASPNPFFANLQVEFPRINTNTKKITMNIYNISGSIVAQVVHAGVDYDSLYLDLTDDNITSGIYILQLIVEEKSFITKIIKL
jgi:hypothetical protein